MIYLYSHQIDKHLIGEIHKTATTFELQENSSTVQKPSAKHKTKEKDIQECITSSAESTYLLMQTAYEMTLGHVH